MSDVREFKRYLGTSRPFAGPTAAADRKAIFICREIVCASRKQCRVRAGDQRQRGFKNGLIVEFREFANSFDVAEQALGRQLPVG